MLMMILLLVACRSPQQVTITGKTMGTTYTVKLIPLPENTTAEQLQAEIDQVLATVNSAMSTYDKNSELSRFNQNPSTDWVDVSTELFTVVAAAQEISRLSGGAFDATVGPLVNLWSFGPTLSEDRIPDPQAIAEAKQRVSYQHIEMREQPPALRKTRPDIYVDLSAIAKGYGVDRVTELLEQRGVNRYLVEIGGEMRLKGHNRNDQAWQVAIEEPVAGARNVNTIIELTSQSVATSGNYRNFFEQDDQRYSHMLDPHSGWPVKHELASVTVVSDTAMRADGLATALLVLGPEQGYALAQQHDISVLFIMIQGDRLEPKSTVSFQQYLKH